MRNPVSPAFALTLYFRFLTGMSRTLGALDFLSRAYIRRDKQLLDFNGMFISACSRRPSRAAHQSVFPENEVSHTVTRWQCYIVAYRWTEIQRLTAPAYAMRPRPNSNDRLPQSSTGSSLKGRRNIIFFPSTNQHNQPIKILLTLIFRIQLINII